MNLAYHGLQLVQDSKEVFTSDLSLVVCEGLIGFKGLDNVEYFAKHRLVVVLLSNYAGFCL